MRGQLKSLMQQTRRSMIDRHTQSLLIDELKKRVRRDQPAMFDEVRQLVGRLTSGDVYSIQPVLQRYYLKGLYRDHEDIRFFLKSHLDSWPHESIRVIINGDKSTLNQKARHVKQLTSITFPSREVRELPLVSSIMQVQDDRSVDPLPIDGTLFADKDQKYNTMLTKVLKLYRFLMGNSFIHSRNLQSPTVMFPLRVTGDEIAQCRKNNIIKKKLRYMRHVLQTIPPLELEDSRYLTQLTDSYYADVRAKKIRREYKKFLRRTFTIDQDFNITLNKYAFIIAKQAPGPEYFINH